MIASSQPDAAGPGIAAMVTFGVNVRAVDDLIQALHGSDLEPACWLVFEYDLPRLGALDKTWSGLAHIIVCAMPSSDERLVEVALDVMQHEGVPIQRCAWLHAHDARSAPPQGPGLVLDLRRTPALTFEGIADRIRLWWRGAGSVRPV